MIQRLPLRRSATLAVVVGMHFLLSCSDGDVVAQDSRGLYQSGEPSISLPPRAAAMLQRFEAARYTTIFWVNDNAAPGGDGSARQPFSTIGAALLRTRACTEIRVLTGTYNENVRFERNLDGASDCPIRLVSYEGAGNAKIIAPDRTRSAVGGGGSENIMVEGFSITGGKNGIQFGQNGVDWTDLARNIVIRFNTITNPVDDGVKLNGIESSVVAHNTLSGGSDEAIDLFGAIDVGIVRNSLGPMQTPSGALTIKAGSRSILVSGNTVRGIATQGIVVGGRTGAKFRHRSGYEDFEADDVRVYGNRVERVGKVPLVFLGATNSQAWNNQLSGDGRSPMVVVSSNLAAKGGRLIRSSGVRGWNNRYITSGRRVRIDPDSTNIKVEEQSSAQWNMPTGPDMTKFRP